MFDFAWSELAVIGVVALLVIGPKDLPKAIKAVGDVVRKARNMAAEFRTHVDDMVKDADLAKVRDQINEIRNFDVKGAIEREVDRDGSIRTALNDPFANTPQPLAPYDPPAPEEHTPPTTADFAPKFEAPPDDGLPAFIPPAIANPVPLPDFLPPATPRPLAG